VEVGITCQSGVENHVAAAGLKKDIPNISNRAPSATWTLPPYPFGSPCSSAAATGDVSPQSHNGRVTTPTPDFTDEEVPTVYVFGLIKKRSTISEIHEYVDNHFSD
jgi:hypothetical protein